MKKLRYLLNYKQVLIGGGLVGLFCIFALLAPFIAPYNYYEQDYSVLLQSPSVAHLFGTDQFGRDIFSRVIFGIRTSLLTAGGTALLSGFVGVFLGSLAGYFGGWIDRLIQSLVDIAWTFPTLLLAVALVIVLAPGQMSVVIAISAGWWAQYARVMRAEVQSAREEDYVEAANAAGASDSYILFKGILPNAIPSVTVLISTTMGRAIVLEAMLSFLGIGIQPPIPSWGTMLSNGRDFITSAYWYVTFPGIALSLTVLGFNLLGDGLRDILDPYIR